MVDWLAYALMRATKSAVGSAVNSIVEANAKKHEQERQRLAREQAEQQARRAREAEKLNLERLEKERQERAQRCCVHCGTIVTKAAAFCYKCGASKFTTIGGIRAKAAEEEQRRLRQITAAKEREEQKIAAERLVRDNEMAAQRKLEQKTRAAKERLEHQRQETLKKQHEELERQRQRRNAAGGHCRRLLASRYCEHCNTACSPVHQFCSVCGGATEPVSDKRAFDSVRDYYPDILKTQEDFAELVTVR